MYVCSIECTDKLCKSGKENDSSMKVSWEVIKQQLRVDVKFIERFSITTADFDIEGPNRSESTLLLWACENGYLTFAKSLINAKATVVDVEMAFRNHELRVRYTVDFIPLGELHGDKKIPRVLC